MTYRRPPAALADEFFLIAHDDRSGRARLHPRAVSLGLAGALLGELLLAGRVQVRFGLVGVVHPAPVSDPLAEAVLDQLREQRTALDAHTWLAFLARGATDAVAQRLVRGGRVTLTRQRLGLWRPVRYLPTNLNDAAWPATRLRLLLSRADPVPTADVLLAGLVRACGLLGHVLWDNPPGAAAYLEHLASRLPPPARELLAQTEAAVGNTVLAARA
jgi:Golgi phosphoprotein 3 (GPP34)